MNSTFGQKLAVGLISIHISSTNVMNHTENLCNRFYCLKTMTYFLIFSGQADPFYDVGCFEAAGISVAAGASLPPAYAGVTCGAYSRWPWAANGIPEPGVRSSSQCYRPFFQLLALPPSIIPPAAFISFFFFPNPQWSMDFLPSDP